MKHFLQLLICITTLSQMSYAQVSGFAITGLSTPTNMPTTICGLTANMSFSALTPSTSSTGTATIPYVINGNNFSGFQFNSVVNWGDGATSQAAGGQAQAAQISTWRLR